MIVDQPQASMVISRFISDLNADVHLAIRASYTPRTFGILRFARVSKFIATSAS